MRRHQQPSGDGRPWRDAEHDSGNDLCETDMAFSDSMVQQVEGLHDEERDVSGLRCQHQWNLTLAPTPY